MARKVWVIGISGPTCSGKTTLVAALKELFTGREGSSKAEGSAGSHACEVLHQDDFYKDRSTLEKVKVQEKEFENWDSPEVIRHEDLLEAILAKRRDMEMEGETDRGSDGGVAAPKTTKTFASVGVLFVEGFVLFQRSEITELFDLKFLLLIDKATSFRRRMERDDWLRDPENTPYFEAVIWPEFEVYNRSILYRLQRSHRILPAREFLSHKTSRCVADGEPRDTQSLPAAHSEARSTLVVIEDRPLDQIQQVILAALDRFLDLRPT
jgi:nicotinamide/nicotinate riboside kinase